MSKTNQTDNDQASMSPWIKSIRPPDGLWNGKIIMLNNSEFLVAIGSHKIFKYSSRSGKWTEVVNTDSIKLDRNSNIVVDKRSNRMFITGPGGTMSIIDLQSNTLIEQTPSKAIYEGGKIVNANGVIHKVYIEQINDDDIPEFFSHEIWNEDQHRWIPNQAASANLIQLRRRGDHWFSLYTYAASLLHVPSKNIILLFGGTPGGVDAEYYPWGIWRYHISTGQWEQIPVQPQNKSYLGISVAVELHPNFCGGTSVVLSADQQYVVIVGAEEIVKIPDDQPDRLEDGDCDAVHEESYVEQVEITQKRELGFMYVLDIREEDDYKFWMSSIAPPKSDHPVDGGYGCRHTYRVARTDECYPSSLVSGWIRTLFATEAFIEMTLPALAIVNLIGDYNKSETIHWISCCGYVDNEVNHQMIPLEQISLSH